MFHSIHFIVKYLTNSDKQKEIGKTITINSHRVKLAATTPPFIYSQTSSSPSTTLVSNPPITTELNRSRTFSLPQNYQEFSPSTYFNSSPNYSHRASISSSNSNGRLYQPQF